MSEHLYTQRFHVALTALGYRGLLVLDQARVDSHEHPCPSTWCVRQLRDHGHLITDGVDCCICWGATRT